MRILVKFCETLLAEENFGVVTDLTIDLKCFGETAVWYEKFCNSLASYTFLKKLKIINRGAQVVEKGKYNGFPIGKFLNETQNCEWLVVEVSVLRFFTD